MNPKQPNKKHTTRIKTTYLSTKDKVTDSKRKSLSFVISLNNDIQNELTNAKLSIKYGTKKCVS